MDANTFEDRFIELCRTICKARYLMDVLLESTPLMQDRNGLSNGVISLELLRDMLDRAGGIADSLLPAIDEPISHCPPVV